MRRPERPSHFAHVGEWIKYNREKERYSLKGLSEEFSKSHSWLNKVEKGEIRANREIVERVADLTHADASEGLTLLSIDIIGGNDPVEYLPPVEQKLIKAFRSNPVFKSAVMLMLGNQSADNEHEPRPQDERTASERAAGVPVVKEKPAPPTRGGSNPDYGM